MRSILRLDYPYSTAITNYKNYTLYVKTVLDGMSEGEEEVCSPCSPVTGAGGVHVLTYSSCSIVSADSVITKAVEGISCPLIIWV